MILIDTSAWVDFFRGRDPIASAVDETLASDEAALCGPVELELRRGLRNERERATVLPLLDACHLLSQPRHLWTEAGDLGFALRRRGVTPKTLDLLITAYALTHSASLLTTDKDFLAMVRAGVPLQLALN
jgi:tRNA(fMet)-specific endonuclease VapC